ncbi:hypothetical protein TWF696_009417 [Orbilia brochopaga]|uniref:F-box domain-containing protein n=1 Tax=Orbilia brochopaga TaxID=3140254 RepID=A0AAV9UF04_9PEZI
MDTPLDIHLLILQYLTVSDLKAYSLCSKWHRDLVLPLLFRSLRLSQASARAFEIGGCLGHLNSSVRRVALCGSAHQSDIARNIDLARICCEGLRLFPRIVALQVAIAVTPEFHFPLVAAIVSKLSACPFYRNLKTFSLHCTVAIATSPIYRPPEAIQGELSPDGLKFIGGLTELPSYFAKARQCIYIPWPLALEEASTTTLNSLQHTSMTPLPLPCYPIFRNSAATLKRLKIVSATVYALLTALPASPYPSVGELWLAPTRGDGTCGVRPLFERVVEAFPNVRDLRFDMEEHTGTWYRPSDVVYTMLGDLAKLQRAQLPWPHNMSLNLVSCGLLQFSVSKWANPCVPSAKGGLQDLKYIDFVAGPTWSRPEHAIYRVTRRPNGKMEGILMPLKVAEYETQPFED